MEQTAISHLSRGPSYEKPHLNIGLHIAMNLPSSYRLNTLSRVLSLVFLSVSGVPCAFAQSTLAPTDLGTVGASATPGPYRPDESKKGTASALAPTQASLLATEPQSII